MPYTCPVCSCNWRSGQKSIQCTTCQCWVHHNNKKNCSGLTNTEFDIHCNETDKAWECDRCLGKSLIFLPFSNLDESNWETFNNIKPRKEPSENIKIVNSKHLKDFVSQCDSIQTLINQDCDDGGDDDNHNEPLKHVNSKYYSIKQLNSLKLDTPSSFGLLHVNVASLQKHFDDLDYVLSNLKYKFDIIGISEHKIIKDTSTSV